MTHKGRQPDCPILIVDDESHALKSFELTLRSSGLNNIVQCQKSSEVMHLLENQEIEVILLDILMPELTGEELLGSIVEHYPGIPVLMVTGLNEVETAVRCMQKGAFDYVLKPVEKERLVSSVHRAIELRRLRRENAELTRHFLAETIEQPDTFSNIITQNRKMMAIFKYCEAIGHGSHPILITGETGVGKELVAEAIHKVSARRATMVAVNVAGLDDNVFSDTLFGHIKGAFTGAASIRSGYIEKAAGGSLFLDEIGDLSPASQVKLLRLLDKHEYFPLGSDTARSADVRFIFATHKDLPELVKKGLFRKDLFFRLHTHHIHIPPLRERLDDLPLLLEYFIGKAAGEFNKPMPLFGPQLIEFLMQYPFPGNVRELISMVFDAVGRNNAEMLPVHLLAKAIKWGEQDLTDFSFVDASVPSGADQSWLSGLTRLPTLKELTAAAISEALRRSRNNQRQAARMLGITPQALSQRLKKKPS
jgi:DNA-binding NtrC family response regulator